MSTIRNQLEKITIKSNRSQSITKEALKSDLQSSKLNFHSKNIFAFQEDYCYFDLEERNTEGHDTFYIPPNSNLECSNFFSTYNEKSQFLRLNDTTTEKQTEDDNHSFITFDLDIEKQVNILTDCMDDLNDAKLSVNDLSLLSEPSIPHNMTTPINRIPLSELDEKSSNINDNGRKTNANILSQQSFSSLFEKIPSEIPSTYSSMCFKTETKEPFSNQKPNRSNPPSFEQQSNSVDLTKQANSFFNQLNYDVKNKFNPEANQSFHSNQQKIPYQKCMNYKIPFVPFTDYNDKAKWSQMHQNTFDMSYPYPSPHTPHQMKHDSSSSSMCDIVQMLKEQVGSKTIQKRIEENNPEFLMKLYEKMKYHLYDVICDKFGNYVIQVYVQYCDKVTISKMLKQLQPKLYEISINSYSTRALQKMIECSSMSKEDSEVIMDFIKGNVFNMINDVNGNHVIQTIIQVSDKKALTPLYQEMNERIVEISKLKEGGCVFPKVLSNSSEDHRTMLILKILDNIDELINNDYGNFIIQHIIRLNNHKFNAIIYKYIETILVKLSSQKYSSNVIQTCLEKSSEIKGVIIDKMIEKSMISVLIADQYGNYIIQKGLQNSTKAQFNLMMEQIRKAAKKLNESVTGKKIYDNLCKNYKDYLRPRNNNNHNQPNKNGNKKSQK